MKISSLKVTQHTETLLTSRLILHNLLQTHSSHFVHLKVYPNPVVRLLTRAFYYQTLICNSARKNPASIQWFPLNLSADTPMMSVFQLPHAENMASDT